MGSLLRAGTLSNIVRNVTPRGRPKRRAHRSGVRLWLVPMAILGGIALIAFASVYFLDHAVTGGAPKTGDGAVSRYLHFEPGLISDAMAGLAAMTAAVLGIDRKSTRLNSSHS